MRHSEHWRACFWLLVATVVWGLSFPLIKALFAIQEKIVPAGSSMFFAATAASIRFGAGAIVVAAAGWRGWRNITRLEWSQGLGLALFSGLGIVFQMDALAHTAASTSAFLTQFYCLLIPIWAAWRQRVVPRVAVILSTIMVLVGVGVLMGIRWSDLHVGRGEAETLLAATFFAGQILWLERPIYAPNRVTAFTVIMFAGTAVLLGPIAMATAPRSNSIWVAYASPSVWGIMGAIIVLCTLGAYLLMNRWQRFVSATEAGLIYCVEPVATSLLVLFIPGWLSTMCAINYPNERWTWRLLLGGALITLANVLIQLETLHKSRVASAKAQQNR